MNKFIFGFITATLVIGCAGAVFPYHYYGLQGIDYSAGKLLGPTPADDLMFNVCQPSTAVANPCVVMKATEFFSLKQDYEDTQNKLISCQQGGS